MSLLVAGALLAVFWDRQLNHDSAWYLIATRRWLAGAQLYVDLIEVNPPLAFYLTAPAILLADISGWSDLNAQYAVLALAVGACLLASWDVLIDGGRRALPPALALLVGVAFCLVVPAFDAFGQRDHLVLLCLFPWWLGSVHGRSPVADRRQTARAVLAGVGFCLKPFYLLIPLLMALARLASGRSPRALIAREHGVFVVVGAAYLLSVWFWHRPYFDAIVPIARDVYGAYSLGDAVLFDRLRDPALAFAAAALLAGRFAKSPDADERPMLAAIVGALLAYLVQRTGFAYQLIPAWGLIAWYCWRAVVLGRGRTVPALLAVLGLAATSQQALERGFYSNAQIEQLAPQVRRLDPAPRLYALATNLTAGPGLALAVGGRWEGRFPALWWVPGTTNTLSALDCASAVERCRRLRDIDALTRRLVIEDLERVRPSLLVIEEPPGFVRDRAFSWDAFFADEPRYRQFLAGYQRRVRSGRYVLWTPGDGKLAPASSSFASAPERP